MTRTKYDSNNLAFDHVISIVERLGQADNVSEEAVRHARAAALCVIDALIEAITLSDEIHASDELEAALSEVIATYAITRDKDWLWREVEKVMRDIKRFAYQALLAG